MKHLARLLSLLLLVSAGAFFSSCGGSDDDGPSEEETQLGKLKATWELTSATLNDDNQTSLFTDLTLTITGTAPNTPYAYSFSGTRPSPSPWPAAGEWAFVEGSVGTKIIRQEDEVIIDYTVTDATLVLSFECDGCQFPGTSGRTKSISGEWIFTFTKVQ